eukprot:366180-Chlamydomonas_euryale.AAC.4
MCAVSTPTSAAHGGGCASSCSDAAADVVISDSRHRHASETDTSGGDPGAPPPGVSSSASLSTVSCVSDSRSARRAPACDGIASTVPMWLPPPPPPPRLPRCSAPPPCASAPGSSDSGSVCIAQSACSAETSAWGGGAVKRVHAMAATWSSKIRGSTERERASRNSMQAGSSAWKGELCMHGTIETYLDKGGSACKESGSRNSVQHLCGGRRRMYASTTKTLERSNSVERERGVGGK